MWKKYCFANFWKKRAYQLIFYIVCLYYKVELSLIFDFRNRLASGTNEKIQLSSLIAAFQVTRDLIVDEAKTEEQTS